MPLETRQSVVGTYEGVLTGLMGILAPGQELSTEVKYFVLMQLHQLAVGIVILLLRCSYQVLLAVGQDCSGISLQHPGCVTLS